MGLEPTCLAAYASEAYVSTIPPPGLILLFYKSAQSISRVEISAKETFLTKEVRVVRLLSKTT